MPPHCSFAPLPYDHGSGAVFTMITVALSTTITLVALQTPRTGRRALDAE